MRIVVLCVSLVVGGAATLGGQAVEDSSSVEARVVQRFLTSAGAPLTSYRAHRTLDASTRGGRMHARLTAWTWIDDYGRFDYQIIEESGTAIIRNRVLRAALDAERKMINDGDSHRGALNEANYDFEALPSPEATLVRIALRPKRRDTLLLEGELLVTEDDGDLVLVQGRLVKRPSFWTRRVDIVREYARVGGVRVPRRMESVASVLVAGTSRFSMTYDYQMVNGRPVTGVGRVYAAEERPVEDPSHQGNSPNDVDGMEAP